MDFFCVKVFDRLYSAALPEKLGTKGADASVEHTEGQPTINYTIKQQLNSCTAIPQTQQLQMHVYRISVQQSQCSALVMQSEANQCSVIIIQLGVSTMFSTAHAY